MVIKGVITWCLDELQNLGHSFRIEYPASSFDMSISPNPSLPRTLSYTEETLLCGIYNSIAGLQMWSKMFSRILPFHPFLAYSIVWVLLSSQYSANNYIWPLRLPKWDEDIHYWTKFSLAIQVNELLFGINANAPPCFKVLVTVTDICII